MQKSEDSLKGGVEMVGRRFGRLLVLDAPPVRGESGELRWQVKCDCGRITQVRGSCLRRGGTKSCGCLRRDTEKRPDNRTHGHSKSRTYSSWLAMKKRCQPDSHCRAYYFDLGITICERWQSFENFLADMGERPEGMTLDRYPNMAGNYEPGNCRWATKKEQANNRRNTRNLTIDGETLCATDWAARLGIRAQSFLYRLDHGWPIEKLSKPPIRSTHTSIKE